MAETCIKRRLLFACRQTYARQVPAQGTDVDWKANPRFVTAGTNQIDRALVGRIDEGIVLAFRGTLAPFRQDGPPAERVARDWFNNVEFLPRDNRLYPGRVHRGFAQSLEGLWEAIEREIGRLIEPGGMNTLYVTGHSKGGALANLAAWRALGIEGLDPPIRVFTIAAARAGNEDFRAAYHAHGGISCLRYEVALDVVPLVPFGTNTPMWAKPLLKQVARLTDINYVGVGTRVPAGIGLRDAWGAWRHYFRGFGFGKVKEDYLPLLASAHSIDDGSGYDALICQGEVGCTHS